MLRRLQTLHGLRPLHFCFLLRHSSHALEILGPRSEAVRRAVSLEQSHESGASAGTCGERLVHLLVLSVGVSGGVTDLFRGLSDLSGKTSRVAHVTAR